MKWDGTRWRRWTGRRWASAAYALRPERLLRPEPLGQGEQIPAAQRDRILSLAVEDQVLTNGAAIVFQGRHGVVLGYRRQVSHGMHAILTLLTGGLWAIVWYIVASSRTEDRLHLDADAWGNVWAIRAESR
jgi:hypothetical protein